MVHTFELSKSISKDAYEKIIPLLNMRWYKSLFATRDYAEQGFQLIRLYKMKNEMFKSGQDAEDEYDDNENPLMYLYMISLSISTANMFEGSADPHLSQNILNFTPDYVRAVYHKIFELIPFLEVHPEWCFDSCWDEARGRDIVNDEDWLNRKKELNRQWLESNAFKARRIDFAFDLKTMHQQYLTLINRGYSLRKDVYERTYYEDKDTQEGAYDNGTDIFDSEEILQMMADEEAARQMIWKSQIAAIVLT